MECSEDYRESLADHPDTISRLASAIQSVLEIQRYRLYKGSEFLPSQSAVEPLAPSRTQGKAREIVNPQLVSLVGGKNDC